MTRRVELYGRLREAGLGDWLELTLGPRATASQALAQLASQFGPRSELLKGVALATESTVLSPGDPLPKDGILAALPPVCGG